MRSQIATSNGRGGRRYRPYMFTEQGIAMLSGVLRSDVAIQVSIRIMNTFVEMRRFIANNITKKFLYEDKSYNEAVERGIAVVADSDNFTYRKKVSVEKTELNAI